MVKSSVTSLKDLQRSTRRNKYITFKASKTNLSDVADPLVEPYDMTIVTSPCHTWEPIKVREGHVGPMHLSGLWCGILDVIDQAPIATQPLFQLLRVAPRRSRRASFWAARRFR